MRRVQYRRLICQSGARCFGAQTGKDEKACKVRKNGVQAVQEIESIGSSMYVSYRYHSLDRTGSSFDDIHAVMEHLLSRSRYSHHA